MQQIKAFLNFLNYTGYCVWSLSIYSFLDELLNNSVNLKSINSFLSCIATVVAIAFGIAKLFFFIRDSITKSQLLKEDLQDRIDKRNNSGINFYKKFNDEFNKQSKL